MNTYEGNLVANNIKIGIVVARFIEQTRKPVAEW